MIRESAVLCYASMHDAASEEGLLAGSNTASRCYYTWLVSESLAGKQADQKQSCKSAVKFMPAMTLLPSRTLSA